MNAEFTPEELEIINRYFKFMLKGGTQTKFESIEDKDGSFLFIGYTDNARERLADLIYKPQEKIVTGKEALKVLLDFPFS